MENMKKILLFNLVISTIFVGGCIVQVPFVQDDEEPPGSPYLPIETTLSISNPLALGETAELTVTFSAELNASDISTSIELPEGLEYVSGDLSWNGDVFENEQVQFSAVVKAVKTGTWLVMARGFGYDQLYLTISENSASVSKNPPPNSNEVKMAELLGPANISQDKSTEPNSGSSGVEPSASEELK